jgi:hypothetical protein
VGVPLLIYASTFIESVFEKHELDFAYINRVMQSAEKHCNNEEILSFMSAIKRAYEDDVEDMVVTIKDVEECVEILSKIIANALNIALGIEL